MEKIKVLAADDDGAVLELIEAILTNAGYTAICVRSGNEVFTKIKEELPDVILLDVGMPGLDGFKIKGRLNEDITTAGIPVIFVTAYDAVNHKTSGSNLGAYDYITKPFDNHELVKRIETALKKKPEPEPEPEPEQSLPAQIA